jgi:hypothetical protein
MTTTTRHQLPLAFDQVRIASPCHKRWSDLDLDGDERVRFCSLCQKNVYNLSALTRADAEALIREKEGRLCVRFFRRSDGTILTADCPVGARRLRLRQRARTAMARVVAVLTLALGGLVGRARADHAVGTVAAKPEPWPPPITPPMKEKPTKKKKKSAKKPTPPPDDHGNDMGMIAPHF